MSETNFVRIGSIDRKTGVFSPKKDYKAIFEGLNIEIPTQRVIDYLDGRLSWMIIGNLPDLPEGSNGIFLNKSKTDSRTEALSNVYRIKGGNLTNLGISLIKAYRSLEQTSKTPKRFCIDIVSDVLLHEKAAATTKWLIELLSDLKSKNFTTLAVMDPLMHPPDQFHAVLNLFDGEINLYETKDRLECKKHIQVKKLRGQDYIKNPICLTKQKH